MHLHLDPFSGASGDMFLGLVVDLGAPLDAISQQLSPLKIDGWSLQKGQRTDPRIGGSRVEVLLEGKPQPTPEGGVGSSVSAHGHDHDHDHSHDHDHGHDHGHDHDHGHHPHRNWADIRKLIEESPLSQRVRERSLKVFGTLAEAEAQVHGVTVDEVAFHEVGAIDSIVDIIGACIGLELLGVDSLSTGPITVSQGFVRCAHGRIPTPAPATALLLRGLSVRGSHSDRELATPTGAALLSALAGEASGPMPSMKLEAVGYGLGGRIGKDTPNALRGFLGHQSSNEVSTQLWSLEVTLDDANPQLLARLPDRLVAEGAKDALVAPVQMKKGRAGFWIQAIVDDVSRDHLERWLFRNTPTLGIRRSRIERNELERRFETRRTPLGPVRYKLGLLNGELVNVRPEWADVEALAARSGTTLKQAEAAALKAMWEVSEPT